jgi:Flp pilus assembly protein TadG
VRDDRGIAALELGIFASLLLLVVFGALPLYGMLKAYQSASKTSAATLRYATAVSANGTRTGGTISRRPSYTDIQKFARDTANDPTLEVEVRVCKGATCTDITDSSPTKAAPIPATAGDTVRLTVRTTVDMSLLGRVANATARLSGGDLVFPENDTTIAATAAAREE